MAAETTAGSSGDVAETQYYGEKKICRITR